MKVFFRESQQFRQWWLWVILGLVAFLPVYGIYRQLLMGEKFGSRPMSDFGLVLFFLFVVICGYFFWMMRLKTEINEVGIKIRFIPLTRKDVIWSEIESINLVKYRFVGYGVRLGSEYGTVYNTNGNKGLAIKLKNGKKFLVGTQKERELLLVLNQVENLII